jgi:hypothetical protein
MKLGGLSICSRSKAVRYVEAGTEGEEAGWIVRTSNERGAKSIK